MRQRRRKSNDSQEDHRIVVGEVGWQSCSLAYLASMLTTSLPCSCPPVRFPPPEYSHLLTGPGIRSTSHHANVDTRQVKWPPIRIRARGVLPDNFCPTANSDDGFNIPATKRARWCYDFNLDVFVQTLSLAKDTHTCGVLPAQVAFGSTVVPLTMIRVRLSPTMGTSPDSRRLGHDGQRSGLCQSWAGLR